MDSRRKTRDARLSRRDLLALGAAWPAGALAARLAGAQGFSAAPLAPKEARGHLEHRFWRDLLEDFPLEPGERYFANADQGIQPLQTLERMHRVATEVAAHAVTGATDHVEAAREAAARFFGADASEIALAHGAAEAMAAVAEALPLAAGAAVSISRHEPPSSLIPWVALARSGRCFLRPFTPQHDPGAWKSALSGAAALVVSHVTPPTGEIVPLEQICAEARKQGTLVVANGSHAAGMVPVNLHGLGVDAYVTAGSGFLLGPRDTALVYLRRGLQSRLTPRYRHVDAVQSKPPAPGLDGASALELGPRDPSRAAGLAASLGWLTGLGVDVVREHATLLAQQLYDGVVGTRGIEVLTPAAAVPLCPIVGIRVSRRPTTQVVEWLRSELAVRVHPVTTPGLNSIRVATHLVNRTSDVEALVEGIRRLA